jgi:rod shape-determining protein MreC
MWRFPLRTKKTRFNLKLPEYRSPPWQTRFPPWGRGSFLFLLFRDVDRLRKKKRGSKDRPSGKDRNLLIRTGIRKKIKGSKTCFLKESLGSAYDLEAAKIVAKETRDFSTVFTVSKGTLSGIAAGDAVITRDGLLGYVSEAGPNFAKIATLFEAQTAVGAICIRTADSGVIESDLTLQAEGFCKMSYISKDAGIMKGDYVETSGYGGVYPPGLLIGRVEEISLESHGISQYAKVSPVADLKNPKEDLIIKSFQEGETTLEREDVRIKKENIKHVLFLILLILFFSLETTFFQNLPILGATPQLTLAEFCLIALNRRLIPAALFGAFCGDAPRLFEVPRPGFSLLFCSFWDFFKPLLRLFS